MMCPDYDCLADLNLSVGFIHKFDLMFQDRAIHVVELNAADCPHCGASWMIVRLYDRKGKCLSNTAISLAGL